jgi:hypothetical protein
MSFKTIIFGEYHTVEDRNRIEEEILRLSKIRKINFILSEELGPHKYFSTSDLNDGIARKMYSISDRTFKLAKLLHVPAIGIDLWDKSVYRENRVDPKTGEFLDAARSFKLREKYMLKTILEYSKKGNCVVLVGDSHLRITQTTVLGEPSIITKTLYNNPDFTINRSPLREVE